MRNWLAKYQPTPWLGRKLVMLGVLIGVGAAAFCWGRWQHVDANPPQAQGNNTYSPNIVPGTPGATTNDYDRRVVAYIYNNIPVMRDELGEYLIARFGAERLDFMINRKIVEMQYSLAKLPPVTDEEVQARFARDLSSFGMPMTEKEFVGTILKRFGKTLYEWKEDVIRPKLMMEKLVQPKAASLVGEKDLRDGFEARHGAKVECRMIVLDKSNMTHVQKVWENARKGRKEFLEEAKNQFIPNLASIEGKVPPIHKHFGDDQLEDAAFRLKEGQVSGLISLKDGTIVLLYCEKHLPADASKRFEDERAKLLQEMRELRLAQRIPEEFAEMRKQANPKSLLTGAAQASVAPPPPLTSMKQEFTPPAPIAAPVTSPQGPSIAPPPPLPSATQPTGTK